MSIDIGWFQWTQLPMGVNVASDVFQKKIDEIFQNVWGVTGIADDMIIYRKSRDEHDIHFLNILSVVRKNNLRLNASKLQFQLEDVSFFGHNWNSKGISPDSNHKTGGISPRQGINAKLPSDGQFPEQIFSMTCRTFYLSQRIV